MSMMDQPSPSSSQGLSKVALLCHCYEIHYICPKSRGLILERFFVWFLCVFFSIITFSVAIYDRVYQNENKVKNKQNKNWGNWFRTFYNAMKLVSGTGSGMVIMVTTLILTEYFEKYRPMAFGIAAAGAGLGNMFYPWLTKFLQVWHYILIKIIFIS